MRTASRLTGRRKRKRQKKSVRNDKSENLNETQELTNTVMSRDPATVEELKRPINEINSEINGTSTVEVHSQDNTSDTVDIEMDKTGQSKYEENDKDSRDKDKQDKETASTSSSGSAVETTSRWKKKITETLTHVDLDNCDPEICVNLIRIPSIQLFGSLKKKIKQSGTDWIQGFLDAAGLDVLFDCVDTVGNRRVNQLADALLLAECVACIKTVLNSKIGLDYLSQNSDYTKKLVKGKILYFSKPSCNVLICVSLYMFIAVELMGFIFLFQIKSRF